MINVTLGIIGTLIVLAVIVGIIIYKMSHGDGWGW